MKNLKENQQLKRFLGGYEKKLENYKEVVAKLQLDAGSNLYSSESFKKTLSGLKDPDICLELLDKPLTFKKGTASIRPLTAQVKEVNKHLTQIIADAGKSPKRAEVLLNKLNKELSTTLYDKTELASLINAVGRTGDEAQVKALYNSLESFMSTSKNSNDLHEIVTGIKNLSQNNKVNPEFLKIPKRVLSDSYFKDATALRTNATQAISNFEGQYDYLKNLLVTNRLTSYSIGEPLASVFKSAVKDGPKTLKDFKELVLSTNRNLFGKIIKTGYSKNLSKEETNILKTQILQHLCEPQYQKTLQFEERMDLQSLMN